MDKDDPIVSAERRRNMQAVRSGDTKPEIAVRKLLHRLGYRFRLRRLDLPGKPDIVLPRHRLAVFVHGCFWHRHDCKRATLPKTRTEFWEAKLSANVARDARVMDALHELGWQTIVVWECEIGDHQLISHRITAAFASEQATFNQKRLFPLTPVGCPDGSASLEV